MCNGPKNTFERGPRLIPVKSVKSRQNPIRSLGDVVGNFIYGRTDGIRDRHTHNGQNVITKAHLVTMWQVS